MATISFQSSPSWINDSIWASSVQSDSDQILMMSSDGSSVPFPRTVLLAISPLLREVVIDGGCLCSSNILIPSVKVEILFAVSEILRFGESSGLMEINHGRKYLKKVQSVLDLLQISACVGLKIASGP